MSFTPKMITYKLSWICLENTEGSFSLARCNTEMVVTVMIIRNISIKTTTTATVVLDDVVSPKIALMYYSA